MFALHALWRADRTLAVWGEDAGDPETRGGLTPPHDGTDGTDAAPALRWAGAAVVRDEADEPDAGPATHPGACPHELLAELVGGVGPGLEWLAGQAERGTAALWLPTLGGHTPQPSPELPGEPLRGPRPDLALRAWRVPALLFDADEAAQLLGALYDPRHAALRTEVQGVGPVDVPYGASLRWLTAVHDLAWTLVGRGHVLPGVDVGTAAGPSGDMGAADVGPGGDADPGTGPDGCADVGADTGPDAGADVDAGTGPDAGADVDAGTGPGDASDGLRETPRAVAAWARWMPALTEDDWTAARALAAACPPVCRAEYRGETAPAPDATALVAALLDALVDREARAAVEGLTLLPRRGRGVRAPETVVEEWLAALTTETGRIRTQGGGGGNRPPGARTAAVTAVGGEAALSTDLPMADPHSDAPQAALGAHTRRDGRSEVDRLAAALSAWHATERAPVRPLRVCFRLVEPLGPDPADLFGRPTDDNWRVDILLQATDEPSLLVDAARVWGAGPVLNVFERKQVRPQEALLADLERAARVWPALDAVRHTARPGVVRVDRDGALAFLRDAAPGLAAAGFGVLLPGWWRNPPKVGLTLSARTATPGVVSGGSVLDQDAVVAFEWRAALGDDQPLTAEELRELVDAKQPLVRFRGQWLEADPSAIAAAAAFLARQGTGVMTAGEVLRVAVDPGAAVGGLPVFGVDADAWLGELLSGAEALRGYSVSPPDWFGADLRPYQRHGLDWLAFLSRLGVGAVLADDMGLGKTVQTLALLAVEHEQGGAGPTLVVCPMSLVGNWLREAERFTPKLRTHVHHGADRLADDALRAMASGADLVVTTYETAHRDAAALRTVAWRRVVADEAQHIKNIATRQSRAIRSLPARHRIALTGTPVENRLAELHSVLDFANPGLFGTAEHFKATYAIAIERNGSERALAALRRVAAPFVLRRRKSDPAIARDLPAKQEMTVLCSLSHEQAGLYRAVVADMEHRIAHTAGIERQGLILATLGRLKQICNHPAQFLKESGTPVAGRSGKVERLVATLEEALAEGEKTLCFTQYAAFGALLHGHLSERLGTEVLFLHGGVTGAARAAMVDRFQRPDGPGVFLLSLKAGGTGLNLTQATQVIHLDRWWNPAVEDQATDRAHRIGQERPVQVRKFVCVGTVEERIDALVSAKRGLAEAVVGLDEEGLAGEHWLTDLSADALRDLVALAEEAEA
ncbi:DEAD/DEAH box helicase [Yinghuangia seranimata]|uniref:DEAD/DEAH box helicase n=1 Tax=Yinghuangia seranimata TaxID=408067 RepID=UPI00248CA130|nr:DEAD/DEAH box helicase [Yinghuangia seranimata]MDI2126534.1 DEAD/DEAH box helicase [Yinghuangia seranimata]